MQELQFNTQYFDICSIAWGGLGSREFPAVVVYGGIVRGDWVCFGA
jgi:hypothetical protein